MLFLLIIGRILSGDIGWPRICKRLLRWSEPSAEGSAWSSRPPNLSADGGLHASGHNKMRVVWEVLVGCLEVVIRRKWCRSWRHRSWLAWFRTAPLRLARPQPWRYTLMLCGWWGDVNVVRLVGSRPGGMRDHSFCFGPLCGSSETMSPIFAQKPNG